MKQCNSKTAQSGRQIFASRLKAERKRAGLTQEALGVLAGIQLDVARTRINRYERAVHDCDSATAQAIARCLGIPLACLYVDNDEQADVVRLISEMPRSEVRRCLDSISKLRTAALATL